MKKFVVIVAATLLSIASSAAGIRVMSYNIRRMGPGDGANRWDLRKQATAAMIYDLCPVIFGVQEAITEQLDYIVARCPSYKVIGVGRDDGADEGEHMSVLYDRDSLSIIKWGTYWLSETPEVPSFGWDAKCRRTATWALVLHKSSGKKFYFINTHLDHKGVEARRKGLQLIFDRIKKMNEDGLPMVLVGDFNVTPDNPGLNDINKLMSPARFTAENADSCGSFNGWGKYGESPSAPSLENKTTKELLPIDYIYWSGFSKCVSFRVNRRQYAGKKYISDHYPVYSDLEF